MLARQIRISSRSTAAILCIRVKTDETDAIKIARYAFDNWDRSAKLYSHGYDSLSFTKLIISPASQSKYLRDFQWDGESYFLISTKFGKCSRSYSRNLTKFSFTHFYVRAISTVFITYFYINTYQITAVDYANFSIT